MVLFRYTDEINRCVSLSAAVSVETCYLALLGQFCYVRMSNKTPSFAPINVYFYRNVMTSRL